jgi:hypothetical protein
MPRLAISTTTKHPKHPGRTVVTLVGLLHGSPVVSKVSLRPEEYLVVRVVTARTDNGKGRYPKDIRVLWAGSTLEAARAYAKSRNGLVYRRPAGSTQYVRA